VDCAPVVDGEVLLVGDCELDDVEPV